MPASGLRAPENLRQDGLGRAISKGALSKTMSQNLPAPRPEQMLPPILAGSFTPDTRRRVEQFYFSVVSCFEAWVTRRQSPHTQRAYREDFMAFVKFMEIGWPKEPGGS